MAITQIQGIAGTSNTATTSPSFSVAPTSGNLVVLAFAADDYNGTPDTGWTQSSQMEQQTTCGTYIWWRISNGSNPPGSYTIGSAVNSAWVLGEFSGVDSTPYDTSLGSFDVTGGTTYTTPSLTPTAGDRLVIAAVGASGGAGSFGGVGFGSWTNSFIEVGSESTNTANQDDACGMARLIVTANGSTSYSTTGDLPGALSQPGRCGLIISFKASAGAVTDVIQTNFLYVE